MLAWLESADYLGLWITFFILLLLTLWVGKRSAPNFDRPEKFTQGRPMIALELAGSDCVRDVLKSAKDADDKYIEKYRTALGWDFLFIFIYPLCGIVGCLLAIKFFAARDFSISPISVTIGFVLIVLLPLAALLDAVEDFALLRVLRGQIESPWPQVARWCAIPKFAIVIATLLYELFGVCTWIVTKFFNR
jgi:hypothetical protein